MKIIRSRFFPLKRFKAMNFFGVIIARKEIRIFDSTIRHEEIHTIQMREMWYIFFYIWYFIEWLVRLCIERNAHKAYRNISFEREAYKNENDLEYLENRKLFSWFKYTRSS